MQFFLEQLISKNFLSEAAILKFCKVNDDVAQMQVFIRYMAIY
jgi:hypothetical protein